MFDFNVEAAELAGYDTCFFCLGVSSVGMTSVITSKPANGRSCQNRPTREAGTELFLLRRAQLGWAGWLAANVIERSIVLSASVDVKSSTLSGC
jgi:hypothetical protein